MATMVVTTTRVLERPAAVHLQQQKQNSIWICKHGGLNSTQVNTYYFHTTVVPPLPEVPLYHVIIEVKIKLHVNCAIMY